MTKFEECLLHIGIEKTGTTTLQVFFNKNRSNLLEKSILFPTTFGELDHMQLTAYACEDNKKDDLRRILGLTNLKLLENFRNGLFNSFHNEIRKNSCTKLLLSDEHLQSRLTSVEEINFLKKFLDNFVNNYKIVLYLRSQIDLAVSYFSTYCQMGGTRNTVLPEINEKQLNYNYEKLLDRWGNVFGNENLILRIFSRKEFPDGDIKKDFVQLLGLKWKHFDDVPNYNESINADGQRFLLGINKFLPRFVGDQPNKNRGNLVNLVANCRRGEGLLPTQQQVESFMKNFCKSNERLRKKWFPERKELFELDMNKYPQNQSQLSNFTFANKIFAEIWSIKHKQVLSLKEKIEEKDYELKKIKDDFNILKNHYKELLEKGSGAGSIE